MVLPIDMKGRFIYDVIINNALSEDASKNDISNIEQFKYMFFEDDPNDNVYHYGMKKNYRHLQQYTNNRFLKQ